MNKWVGMGRITADPNVRYSQGENSRPIARYTLAVDRRKANADGQREADFIRCVAFDRQAEFAEKFLKQGTKILVVGRIQTGSYTNKDGQKVSTTDIVVEEHEFVESKASAGNTQNGNDGGQFRQPNNYQPRQNNGGYGNPDAFKKQSAPMRNAAVDEGFMDLPTDVDDVALPFN